MINIGDFYFHPEDVVSYEVKGASVLIHVKNLPVHVWYGTYNTKAECHKIIKKLIKEGLGDEI